MGKLRKGQREHSALWNGISPDPASGTWGLIGAAAATKRHVPHRESSSRLNLDAGALRRTLKFSLRLPGRYLGAEAALSLTIDGVCVFCVRPGRTHP